VQLQTIVDTSNRETIELAAKLDIPMHVVASPTFFNYRLLQIYHSIQIYILHSKVNLRDALLMPSATSLIGLPRRRWRLLFDEKVNITARDVKFVNLLVDAGTVNGIKFVRALIANSSLFPEGIPLEPDEMSNWDASDYSHFFSETVQ
jgi:hypothetical protein